MLIRFSRLIDSITSAVRRLLDSPTWALLANEIGNVTIKGLREKRATLAEEAAGILKKASDDSRDTLRADEEEHYQNLHKEIDALTRNIEMRERQEDLETALAKPQGRRADPGQPAAEGESRSEGSLAVSRLRRGQEDSAEAFRSWLLAGSPHRPQPEHYERAKRVGLDLNAKQLVLNLSTRAMRSLDPAVPWEYRTAQGVGTGGIGLYTVPDEMMRPLEVALLAFGGVRQAATVLRTATGADLPFPLVDDTSNVGALVAENTTQTEQGVTFTSLVLNAYKYTSKYILVSVELLQDSAINIPEYIGGALGERIGRITNTHFTTGDGSSKPRGIVAAATLGKAAASGQTTSVTYADLVDLEHSVGIAYRRPNGRFMMADSTVKALKKLVDPTTSRPIWSAGIAVREPDTLLGYPYIINDDIAAMGASNKAIIFGDLSKYLVRDVTEIVLLRLDELFALYQQVCFLAFSRHDGDLLDAGTHPVTYFANAAN
jgi:HK97 family phage major capsid protein